MNVNCETTLVAISNQFRFNLLAAALLGGLSVAGCTSGIRQTDKMCSDSRDSVVTFTNCLRQNYATLTSGPNSQSDLGSLYLAKAEAEAAGVLSGRINNEEAMLELARYRTEYIAPLERQRAQEDVDNFMKSLHSNDSKSASSGSQSASSGYKTTKSKY
jgi:hypothetical protein